MNNTFDIRRFGWYARKEFRENWKAYALGLLGISAILGYNIYQEWKFVHSRYYMGDIYQVEIYTYLPLMMSIIVCLSSSYLLRFFSARKQTFSALILPVSSLEQFLYAWIVAVPFSMLACYIIWEISWSMCLPLFLKDFPNLKINNELPSLTAAPHSPFFFLVGSAIFMWGALTLGRLNFLKTLGILIVVGLVFEWGQNRILKAIFPADFSIQAYSSIPWSPQTAQIKYKGVFSPQFHSTFENVYGFWWILCVPLLLYVITFLKIKEKEV